MNKRLGMLLLTTLTQSVWAANGSLLTGVGPSATAQGGTGVSGTTNTIDAIHKNPALLTSQKYGPGKVNAEVMTTIFKQGPRANTGAGAVDTKSGIVPMPSVGVGYQINSQWALGLGAFTYGGGIADFSNQPATQYSGIEIKHTLMRIQPTVAFQPMDKLSIGVSPFLNYSMFHANEALTGTQSTRGDSTNMAPGFMVGVQAQPAKGLEVGVTYTSKATNYFENAINLSLLTATYQGAAATGNTAVSGPIALGARNTIKVAQPAEIAAGVGYWINDNWRVAFDWRFIGWRGAVGYNDLGWKDQHVFAIGTQYQMNKLKLRAGYNYGKSPIESMSGRTGSASTNFQNINIMSQSQDLLNLVAFPALAEHHISLGAGYAITDALDADLGLMYSPGSTVTRSGTGLAGAYNFTTTVTQWSAALALAYRF